MKMPIWGRLPIWATCGVELGGFIVGASRWSRLGRGPRAITLWFGASAIVDVIDLGLSRIIRNVQPIQSALLPISMVLAVEALASYQVTRANALRFRAVGFCYLLAWAVLHLSVETFDAYSAYSTPLYSIVMLGGAGAVIVQRVLRGRGDFLVDPAFLIAAGLCGVGIATVFKTLVGALWFRDDPIALLAFYSVCNVLTVMAEVLIIRALILTGNRPSLRPT